MMKTFVVTFLIVLSLGNIYIARASADGGVMSQAEFPCQEDEALVYAPQFGPDMVGCINIEEI